MQRLVPVSERTLARRLLVLVGGGHLLAQFVLFSARRAPSWDEAIYLSQIAPGARALAFAPSRARGITLLVAPVLQLGGSLEAVRIFLAAASAVALVAAFWVWIPTVGVAAPLATFLFGLSWLGLLYGSEVMPNLWTAIAAVAIAGLVARRLIGQGRRGDMVLAAVLLGLMALLRPPDALVATGGIVLSIVVFQRREWRLIGVLALGLVLGWLPWLSEMSARYDGPMEAFRRASEVGHANIAGVGSTVLQQLALTDGPLIGPQVPRAIPMEGLLWWGGLVALSTTAIVRGRREPAFHTLAMATLTGSALAAEYLVFVSGLAPRFLLPAYALLAVPSAWALVSLVRDRALARVVGFVVLALLVVWGGWQIATAHRLEATAFRGRASVQDVGLEVRDLAGGAPCLAASTEANPQIAYAAGCAGRWLRGLSEAEIAPLSALAGGSERVFVTLAGRAPPSSPLASLAPVGTVATEGRQWLVYELPG